MVKALEKLKDEIENQTSSKIIKQIKVTPIFYDYLLKSVGFKESISGENISFCGCQLIVDEKLEKHYEIEYVENNELDWTALILLAVFSQMGEKTDICPYCKIEKLDEKRRVLCEKCHKDLMQKFKEN